jgi:hypothetical protein
MCCCCLSFSPGWTKAAKFAMFVSSELVRSAAASGLNPKFWTRTI